MSSVQNYLNRDGPKWKKKKKSEAPYTFSITMCMYSPLIFDIKNPQKWLFLEEAHENSHLSYPHTSHWFIQPPFLHTSSEPSPPHTNTAVLLPLSMTPSPTLAPGTRLTGSLPSVKVTPAEICKRAPSNPSTLYLVTLQYFFCRAHITNIFSYCLPPFGRRNSTRLGILFCFLWLSTEFRTVPVKRIQYE